MTLAAKDYNIVLTGGIKRIGYSLTSVCDTSARLFTAYARHYLPDYFIGILVSRIIGGDNENICVILSRLCHHRTLFLVPVACRTEHADKSALRQRFKR